MTIHKTVVSDKITKNRTAISKTRTNERTLPMVKKTWKTFREKKQGYQNDYYDNLNNGIVKNDHYQSENTPEQTHDESHNYFAGTPTRQIKIFVYRRCSAEFHFNIRFYKYIKIAKHRPNRI